MNPKLSSTVSVIRLSDELLEFFKTNTRQQIRIRVQDDVIMKIVCNLNGEKTKEQIAQTYGVSCDDLTKLLEFLRKKGVLNTVEPSEDFPFYSRYRRIINFLSDYAFSHEHLVGMWNNIRSSTILIVGLGAVGTWVACNLAQSGIGTLILMDGDTVDLTNLHRQFGFSENDIGKHKVDALEERLHEFSTETKVIKSYDYLDENKLKIFDETHIDLIINCADKPNVDTTSLWIGEYGMRNGIPHIVGGGYNMHLSLIGQTVLPNKTACVKCFQKTLNEANKIDPRIVKKLVVKNRKIGSFPPMCSLIASMVGMEAIKVVSKYIQPSNINRRGEFDVRAMNIKYQNFERRDDCEWCGKNGKYHCP